MNANPENIEPAQDQEITIDATERMTWKIPGFADLSDDDDVSVTSPTFCFENASWCLRLYPGAKKDGESYVGFELVRLSSDVPHHRLQCSVAIQGADIPVIIAVFVFDGVQEHKGKERIQLICSYDHVTDTFELLDRDVLTLQYQVFGERSSVLERCTVLLNEAEDVESLRHDFKELLVNGEHHDVTLRVKGKEFKAHKDVLQARSSLLSSVLRSMLTHDMVEENTGVIDLPDCDPHVFKQFLIYLYCGELETLDASNMLTLYYLSNKYDVGSLKKRCRAFVKTSMTFANFGDVIQLAIDYSDAYLIDHATKYFVKNLNKVLATEKWKCFLRNDPMQANELFIEAAKRLSEGSP